MTALLLLFATIANARDVEPAQKALELLEHVRVQHARLRTTHRDVRQDNADQARCLAQHRRDVRDLVWSAELLAADVRYAGRLGYPEAPWEPLVRLRGVVGRVDGHVSDAASCLGVATLPVTKPAVADIEPLPPDTEIERDGLFERWQRPPEVQPFT